jgi:virulence factor Mce-like protein
MIGRRVIVNLVAFLVLTGVLIGYGAFTLLGNPLDDPRRISTVLSDASGLREGFSVDLDGVVVGVVDDIELDQDGVRVTVALDDGVVVPGDVEATVVRASAVGEQRLELTPTAGGTAPPLGDGDEVPAAADHTPPELSDVLRVVVDLVEAIPTEDLNTVVHEAATAVRGRADDLRSLTANTDVFNRELVANEADFRRLLAAAPPVLDAVAAVGPELRSALANTRVLSEVLAERRFDLVHLMQSGADLGEQAGAFLDAELPNLGCLLSDLADLSAFMDSGDQLADLDESLALNRQFFGPVDLIAPEGPAIDVGLGAPARNDQTWLRVRTLVPPGEPPAIPYEPKRQTPDTKPGAACLSEFGPGVPAASQVDPVPPLEGGELDPPGQEEAAAAAGPADGPGADVSSARQASDTRTANPTSVPLVVLGAIALLALPFGGWRAGVRRTRRQP